MKLKIIIPTIAALSVAFIHAWILEKYFFETKIYHLGKKGLKGRLKILFLSDLHFTRSLDISQARLAKTINRIDPDIILIAGDIIDENGIYAPAKSFFSSISYQIPKVAILGNHDHKSRIRYHTYKQLFAQINCSLLVNQSEKFILKGRSLMVTGVDDFIEGNASFAKSVQNVTKEESHILLIHSPLQQETILKELKEINASREEQNKLNIRYIFAGHNHGGQVCIGGFAPVLPEKAGSYLKGWYNNIPPYLYLSRGFGTSTLPFRFGARAEITIMYL